MTKQAEKIDWKRNFFIVLGVSLFLTIYFMPPWKDAVDPAGKVFQLSPQGKAAIGLFLMAGIWWVFEVLPIGVTSLAIGVTQALFAIRPAKEAFKDFMDPSVMFIKLCIRRCRPGFHQDRPDQAARLQNAGSRGRKDEHDPPGGPRRDGRTGPCHGAYGSGGDGLPDSPGDLRPLW